MIDEATFDQINRASFENGWDVEAIIETVPGSGQVETQGLIMFKQSHQPANLPGIYYGVAEYVGNADTKRDTNDVHFGRGTYDMSRDQALSHLSVRSKG